tara:strand:+ start:234 stop:1007 length:774 start_codon:yes stop_codon:yes gene_type:complete
MQHHCLYKYTKRILFLSSRHQYYSSAATRSTKNAKKFNRKGNNKGKRKLKGKTASSSQWLQRQDKDPFVAESIKDGYPSRAAYKLIDIQKQFNVIQKGFKILDLGCCPGSWLMVAKKFSKNSRVVGIDLIEFDPPIDGVEIIQGDFEDENVLHHLSELLNGKVDLILSDMSPNLTGMQDIDQINMMSLQSSIIEFLPTHLKTSGNLVTKTFRGQYDKEIFETLKENFKSVKRYKPPASRSQSKEIYMISKGFKQQQP